MEFDIYDFDDNVIRVFKLLSRCKKKFEEVFYDISQSFKDIDPELSKMASNLYDEISYKVGNLFNIYEFCKLWNKYPDKRFSIVKAMSLGLFELFNKINYFYNKFREIQVNNLPYNLREKFNNLRRTLFNFGNGFYATILDFENIVVNLEDFK